MIVEFRNQLAKALDDLSLNEWAVAEWRSSAVEDVSCVDAFESILPLLELAIEQTDYYAFEACCVLALQFADVAQTTEKPDGLVSILGLLNAHEKKITQSKCIVKDIEKWFRA